MSATCKYFLGGDMNVRWTSIFAYMAHNFHSLDSSNDMCVWETVSLLLSSSRMVFNISLLAPFMNTEKDTWPKVRQPGYPLPLKTVSGLELSTSQDGPVRVLMLQRTTPFAPCYHSYHHLEAFGRRKPSTTGKRKKIVFFFFFKIRVLKTFKTNWNTWNS